MVDRWDVPFTVLGDDLILVRHPVLVPAVDSGGVVYTEDIDGLDFEAGSLNLVDNPTEGAGGVCTWEDIFVHEDTPVVSLLLRNVLVGMIE